MHVALPMSRRESARLFIGDTGALMIDVVQATRSGQLTSLVAALHQDAALMYVPRHVLLEIESHLTEYTQRLKRPVDPEAALRTWRDLYAPCIRVVDVPDAWGMNDHNVQAVISDDVDDAATARLAFALAPCFGVAVDPDLADHSFGNPQLLPLLLAAANEGEINLVYQSAAAPVVVGGLFVVAGYHGIRALPGLVRVGLLLGAAGLGFAYLRNGRASKHFQQAKRVAGQLMEKAGPLLAQIHERQRAGRSVWSDYLVQTTCTPGFSEQIARVLAYAPDDGLLAVEVADRLDLDGSIKTRTALVRAALCECDAFTEVRRGRWRLGYAVRNQQPELFTHLTIDWLQRAHRR